MQDFGAMSVPQAQGTSKEKTYSCFPCAAEAQPQKLRQQETCQEDTCSIANVLHPEENISAMHRQRQTRPAEQIRKIDPLTKPAD